MLIFISFSYLAVKVQQSMELLILFFYFFPAFYIKLFLFFNDFLIYFVHNQFLLRSIFMIYLPVLPLIVLFFIIVFFYVWFIAFIQSELMENINQINFFRQIRQFHIICAFPCTHVSCKFSHTSIGICYFSYLLSQIRLSPIL